MWFPILTPVVLSVAISISRRTFLFDYLMPAEMFPVALGGGVLLLWAALRARSRRGLIGWSLGLAAGLLAGCQGLAVASGLASGKIGPSGIWWVLVLTALAGYVLALVGMGVGGILLIRELFKPARPVTANP